MAVIITALAEGITAAEGIIANGVCRYMFQLPNNGKQMVHTLKVRQ
jgi:hypothetical protein